MFTSSFHRSEEEDEKTRRRRKRGGGDAPVLIEALRILFEQLLDADFGAVLVVVRLQLLPDGLLV